MEAAAEGCVACALAEGDSKQKRMAIAGRATPAAASPESDGGNPGLWRLELPGARRSEDPLKKAMTLLTSSVGFRTPGGQVHRLAAARVFDQL